MFNNIFTEGRKLFSFVISVINISSCIIIVVLILIELSKLIILNNHLLVDFYRVIIERGC